MKKAVSWGVLLLIFVSLFGFVGYGNEASVFDDWFFTYCAPNFPEEYRPLLRIVPEGAYDAEQRIDFSNVFYSDHGHGPEAGLIWALFDAGVFAVPAAESKFPQWENNPDAQRAPAYQVRQVCEEIYGPGSFELFKRWEYFHDYTNHFFYRADTDSYEYIKRTAGGGIDNARVHIAFDRIEEQGDSVCLYVRYASYSNLPLDGDDRFRLYADARMRVSGRHEPYFSVEDPGSYLNFVADGGLNEALPLYKNTYRDNGVGGYYWESTELVEEPDVERISTLLAEAPPPSETTDDPISSDPVISEEIRDPLSDLDITDSAETENLPPEEGGDGVRGVGILCAVGVSVAGLLMAAVPVVLHKIQLRKKEK